MGKLISMANFVDLQEETPTFDTPQIDWYDKEIDKLYKIRKYSKFLQQSLNLSMFIPSKFVNGVWVVLEEPKWVSPEGVKWEEYVKEYQEAKDKVLFEGFNLKYSDKFVTTVSNEKLWFNFKNSDIFVNDKVVLSIEDLVKYNLELTPTAQKQIGL